MARDAMEHHLAEHGCRISNQRTACSCVYSDVRLLRSAVARLRILSTAQRIGVVFAAIFYVVAGSLHFIKPDPT